MANTWFRMYSDFLNDPKLIPLAFEDQRHFIGLLALKCDGTIDQDCEESLLNRIVAQKLWVDHSIIAEVKKRLINAKLIDSRWQPIAWNKRQFISDHDLTGAERQKRYRDKQRNALCNATVTLPDTDTDTDTDIKPIDTNVSIARKEKAIPDCPHQEIINLYSEILPMGIIPRSWDGNRASILKVRWREKDQRQDIDWWRRFFDYISKSVFLTGQVDVPGRKRFEIDLPWILRKENFDKIIDGKYH